MRVLVTGGAGYIGSQIVLDLTRAGHVPVVLDNLSKGHKEAVSKARLAVFDLALKEEVCALLKEEEIDAVVHMAAYSLVGESVENPATYFENNIAGSLSLFSAMQECGVKKLVFSSTAAVYGEPVSLPITEDHPTHPTNPYGFSKLTVEGILHWYAAAYGFRYISLRYFNAAGADEEGGIGEAHYPETHLIPLLIQTALAKRESFSLYGTDYPTPDGTCVRDYIHVQDLSKAHLLALDYLQQGGTSRVFNLGNGQGYSNQEVLEMVKQVSNKDFPVVKAERRPGDPAFLVASSKAIHEELGFKPRFCDLYSIVHSAWMWHAKNQRY